MSLKIMQKLTCSSCYTPELYMFTERVDDIFVRNNVTDEELLKMGARLKLVGGKLKNALKNTKVNPLTTVLSRSVKRRRKSYHSFLGFLESNATADFDSAKQRSALFLLAVTAGYGHKIERTSATEFSSALNVMLEEFETPQALQHIQALGAEPFVNDLKDAHAGFENTYQQKIAFDAQQITPDIKADRDDASQLISTLISYLDIGERGMPGLYGNVPSEINEVVGDLMQQIRSRATRNGEKPPADQTPEVAPTGKPNS